MTEPAPDGDLEARLDGLELVVGVLIGRLRQLAPGEIEAVERALARWQQAEAPRSGAEPPSREYQVASHAAALLEEALTGGVDELLDRLANPR